MEKNTAVAKQWLYKRDGDSAPGKSTIIDWYAMLHEYLEIPKLFSNWAPRLLTPD